MYNKFFILNHKTCPVGQAEKGVIMKTLKKAILFTDGTRASLGKLIEKQYKRLQVVYKEDNTWNIKDGKLNESGVFVSKDEEFKLELRTTSEEDLPHDYNFMWMSFAETTDGKPTLSGLPCMGTFAEVVAHFRNHENTTIRMVGYFFGTSETQRKHSPIMPYPLTVLAVNANEYGFYDENGRFWKVECMRDI